MSRFLTAALFCFVAISSLSANAAPFLPPANDATAASPAFEDVASRHCGMHERYVRGHHARNGHWVRGHCVVVRH